MNPQFFTSYFANLKNLPKYIEPIAICGGIPDWYKGLWYKKLAPSWSIWKEWHDSNEPDKNEHYVSRFVPEILGELDVKQVADDLKKMADSKTPCLICYEKPNEFCHRHVVAKWLTDDGFETEEFGKIKELTLF